MNHQVIAAVQVLESAGIKTSQFKTASEILAAAKLIVAAQRTAD